VRSSFTTTTSEVIPTSAMLMAAGLGTRLRPFTDQVPKALVPVMGVPVAQFAMDLLDTIPVSTIVANVHHRAPQAIEGLHRLGRVVISDESSLLLGSAGGIAYALPHLGSRFFILNADVLCEADLRQLALFHHSLNGTRGVKLTLTVFPKGPPGEVYREIVFDPVTQIVKNIGEKRGGGAFFTGVSIAEASLFEHLDRGKPWDFVEHVLLPAVEKGQVAAYVTQGSWYDVGSPLLWWKTHLELIHKLETGDLPPLWRARIEESSKRVAPYVWSSRRTRSTSIPFEIQGPLFLDAPLEGPRVPLGPRTVLYSPHARLGQEPLRGGIGLGPNWILCEQ
jgi:NDP-sugar pyrophosphorylase family protein